MTQVFLMGMGPIWFEEQAPFLSHSSVHPSQSFSKRRHTNTVSILFQEITSDPHESHLYLGEASSYLSICTLIGPLVLITTTTWFVVCLAI